MSTSKKPDISTELFYEGKIRDLNEAGALLMRSLIEEDLISKPDFQEGVDPYSFLVDIFKKNERSIKAWTYDWESDSGTRPTIMDFLLLIKLTRSTRILEFMKLLITSDSPDEMAVQHSDLLQTMADHMRDLADKLEGLSKNK